MNKKELAKETDGITLIALIITIIVMLILIAVTVIVVVNSGLFGHAKDVTRQYTDKQAQEQAIGDGVINIVENGVTYSSLEEYLEAHPGAEIPDTDAPTAPDRSYLSVGDYVQYTPDIVATPYSLTSAVSGYGTADSPQSIPQDTLQWRIMSINSDGTVDLISATPTNTDIYFYGALGYNNGVYVLNDICAKLYSNSTLKVTARSLDLVDIESKMNETGIEERNNFKFIRETITTQYLGTQTYSGNYSFAPDIYDATAITKEEESRNVYTEPTTMTAEQKEKLIVRQTYYGFSETPSEYFEDSAFHELIFNTGSSFWLASRYVNCDAPHLAYGFHRVVESNLSGRYVYDSGNVPHDGNCFARPVVTLGSNIQISTEGGTADAPRAIGIASEN